MPRGRPLRTLLLHAEDPMHNTLAYYSGWPRNFMLHPAFDCTPLNVLGRRPLDRVARYRRLRTRYDIVVVLHSVFSNACYLGGSLLERIAALPAPKAYFVGNEYKLMPEKVAFAEALGVSLLVSQLHDAKAHDLYRERLGCAVAGIPSAGLDVELFVAEQPDPSRPIDVGYRAFDSPWYLGHNERLEIADRVLEAAPRHALRVDISLDPADRLDESGWAAFLRSCKAQLGTEAGGDYFELTDETRNAVNAYLGEHPEAPFTEVYQRFFRDYRNPVSGRAISGRIAEAAATRTVQILLEGEYSGYFEPDVHYIPLRKDFADVDDALGKLRDEELCRRLAENAYEVVLAELRYEVLIDRFRAAAEEVL